MNATMKTFGYPETLVHSYDHWAVLFRPKQVTLGSLVLVCTEPVQRFADVSQDGFSELKTAVADIERVLSAAFRYDKINYLMLMMVDPDVHYHVIPRYSAPHEVDETSFADPGWPGPPELGTVNEVSDQLQASLISQLRAEW